VAIVGSGPAGFFAAAALLRQRPGVEIAILERLPVPYGLVRYGVAPDHAELKRVMGPFEKTAAHPSVSLYGNVHVGRDIAVEELRHQHDAVILACGAEASRRLSVPGADLAGCLTSSDFVGWYNGHPEAQGPMLDASCTTAVVVGNGNVAMDVARILLKDPARLAQTDITATALAALQSSRIRSVILLGRRGPAQSSFSHSELRKLLSLDGLKVSVDKADLQNVDLQVQGDREKRRIMEELVAGTSRPVAHVTRQLRLAFLRSPRSLEGSGRVERIVCDVNRLEGPDGAARAVGTGQTECISCGLVVSCIGYRAVPLPGVPFDEERGVIPNDRGRVNGQEAVGLYVAGWSKSGPRGLIGNSRKDSAETVESLLEDLHKLPRARHREGEGWLEALRAKGVQVTTFEDWQYLDRIDKDRGRPHGKPREKIISVEEMLQLVNLGRRADTEP
jgi:ferredoxin--NADP+ reductase